MAADTASPLLAGAASVDITPPPDCLLDGFAARDHGCEGVAGLPDGEYVEALLDNILAALDDSLGALKPSKRLFT